MRVNSLKHDENKCCLSITFLDETEEHIFLGKILNCLKKILEVNCMIKDLDTCCSLYEMYFEKGNYYFFEQSTTTSIFAFGLNSKEINNVISNWGYFTFDAIFALGPVDDEVKKQKRDCMNVLKSLPVVINQVLDTSIDITMEQCYFKNIVHLFDNG